MLVAGAGLGASPASAAGPEVTSDTSAQFYEVTSPSGEQLLVRRRFTTTLGVAGHDLQGGEVKNPLAPEILFRARLRYDSDFGASSAEVTATSFGRLVPGFQRATVDLMYAYVEGRRFLGGWLGFKLGRQYVVDPLGWWSFDGGQVRVTTPYFVALEAYGGLEQRGGLPLSSSRFERDGVWRGSRMDYDPSLWTAYQPARLAPAFGVAVESAGLFFLHSRLTYRRVYNTGGSNVTEFASALYPATPHEEARISSERIGYSIDGTHPGVGGLKAGLVYDLYVARFSQLYTSADLFAGKRLTLSADYDFHRPTFDGDSIWNFFAAGPTSDLGGRMALQLTDRLSLSGGGRARIFEDLRSEDLVGAPRALPSSSVYLAGGGNLAARYRHGAGQVALRGAVDGASTGGRAGGDLSAEHTLAGRYVLSGRASLWRWSDALRSGRDATGFGYVAGLGYLLSQGSQAVVEFEHDINRLVGNRYRLMVWLTLAVTK